MDRQKKIETVEELKTIFNTANTIIISKNKGLTVRDANNLRGKVREVKSSYRVMKNRLVKIALKDSRFESLTELMTGPTSIAYSDDPVAIAKVLNDFTKENTKLEVVGGVMGEAMLTPEQIKQLAALPSLDELRSKLIGLIQAPAQKIAAILSAPATQIARVISAYSNKS